MPRESALPRVRELIHTHRWAELGRQLAGWEPAALARLAEELTSSEMLALLWVVGVPRVVPTLCRLDAAHRDRLLESLADGELRTLLAGSPAERLGALLEALPEATVLRIRGIMDPAAPDPAAAARSYPEGSAGSLMAAEYPAVLGTASVRAALAALHATQGGTRPLLVYAIDRAGRYRGFLPFARLREAEGTATVETLIEETDAAVEATAPAAEAERRRQEHRLPEIPVVDRAGRLVGVFRAPRR